jgi:hypothetical protein
LAIRRQLSVAREPLISNCFFFRLSKNISCKRLIECCLF